MSGQHNIAQARTYLNKEAPQLADLYRVAFYVEREVRRREKTLGNVFNPAPRFDLITDAAERGGIN